MGPNAKRKKKLGLPLQALSGRVAPWFEQIGGGTQYLLIDGRVDELMQEGAIKLYGG